MNKEQLKLTKEVFEKRYDKRINWHISLEVVEDHWNDEDDFVADPGTLCVLFWFNDSFYWGSSDTITFLEDGVTDYNIFTHRLDDWLTESGDAFFKEFHAVTYPKRNLSGKHDMKKVNAFFEANKEIGKRMTESITEFTGFVDGYGL